MRSSSSILEHTILTLKSVRSPENPKRVLVKRVIGLEGDLVKTLPPYRTLEIRVPKGHIWVEGRSSNLPPISLACVSDALQVTNPFTAMTATALAL